jgi:DNA-binding MarR family transcriptional regulator
MNNATSLLCYKLFHLVKSNTNLIDKLMQKLDLTRTQWKVLIRFNFLPTPCAQQELAKSIEIDRAHLTRTLDQLEKRKLIKKIRLIEDRRAFNITLTKKGEHLLKKVEQILKAQSDQMVLGLEKEQKNIFDELLQKITCNVLNQLENNFNSNE